RFGKPWRLAHLALHVLIDIVVANVEVALLVLGPTKRLRPAFIEVPLDSTHEIALTALISIVSLSPGTLCAELSDDRTRLVVHVLDLADEAALVALIKSRYEAPLMEIFTC
uniref:Na+/H+ antiporter subunit E n=1 Tax=Paraburkholderia sp. TaxID=1926495 RepID=UPI00286EC241